LDPENIFSFNSSLFDPRRRRPDRWLGRSLKQVTNPIEDFAANVGARRAMITAMHGKLPGDPRRAGETIARPGLDDGTWVEDR